MAMDLTVSNPVSEGIGLIRDVVNKFFPDKTEVEKAQLAGALQQAQMEFNERAQKLASETQLAQGQIDIDKIEAADPDKFVHRARPAMQWAGVLAMVNNYIAAPWATFVAGCFGKTLQFPVLDLSVMMPIVMISLGAAGWHAWENVKGGK